MKRLVILATILIVLTALSSCYWMGDFSTGGISMDFSEFQPRAAGDVVRVYLIANGLLFSTNSNAPFMAEEQQLGRVLFAQISEADKRMILGKNAARVLGLNA